MAWRMVSCQRRLTSKVERHATGAEEGEAHQRRLRHDSVYCGDGLAIARAPVAVHCPRLLTNVCKDEGLVTLCNQAPDVYLDLCTMLGKDLSRSTAELSVFKAGASVWRMPMAEAAPHGSHALKQKQSPAGGCMLPSIAAQ